ncbi:hypothetical protein D3C80_587950 [compost metagenome]
MNMTTWWWQKGAPGAAMRGTGWLWLFRLAGSLSHWVMVTWATTFPEKQPAVRYAGLFDGLQGGLK